MVVYLIEVKGISSVDTSNWWTDNKVYSYRPDIDGKEVQEFLQRTQNVFFSLDLLSPYQIRIKEFPVIDTV